MRSIPLVCFVAALALASGCGGQRPAESASGNAGASRESGSSNASAVTPLHIATIPAETLLAVRTTQPVSGATARPGSSFSAELESPIVAGDWLVAPRGARVSGRVVESQPGQVAVRLNSITLADGRRIPVATEPYKVQARAPAAAANIPGQTRLTFRLSEPVTIEEQRRSASGE